jgi:molybdate transport system permease protein
MSDGVLIPLLLTLKIAGCATLLALIMGVAAGYALARSRFPGREALDAVLTLPMVLPPTVLGYYLLVLLGRKGLLGSWLDETFGITLIFTWQGAVLAAAIVAFPLVFKAARAAFENVDGNLEKAARSLGYPELKVFLRVTMPLAWPGVLAGTMLAFARAMGEFGATLMVAGSLPGRTQTLSISIYEAVAAGEDDTAHFLVLVSSIICIIVLVASSKLLRTGYLQLRAA